MANISHYKVSSYFTPKNNQDDLNMMLEEYSHLMRDEFTLRHVRVRPHIWTCSEDPNSKREEDYHVFRVESVTDQKAALITRFQDPLAIAFLENYGTDFQHSETEVPGPGILISEDTPLHSLFPLAHVGIYHERQYVTPMERKLWKEFK